MTKPRESRVIDINDEHLVDWVSDPVFNFPTEVDALTMLEALGGELRDARTQVEHCMRYLKIAARAAGQVEEDGERTGPEAIIRASGLARQTVFDALGGER